jgi:hypothetical protein
MEKARAVCRLPSPPIDRVVSKIFVDKKKDYDRNLFERAGKKKLPAAKCLNLSRRQRRAISNVMREGGISEYRAHSLESNRGIP